MRLREGWLPGMGEGRGVEDEISPNRQREVRGGSPGLLPL